MKENNETLRVVLVAPWPSGSRWNAAVNPNATGQQASEFKCVRNTIFKN